jgi:phosphodiester glycosidase
VTPLEGGCSSLRALCALGMLLAATNAFATAASGETVRFRPVAPGIEYATFEVYPPNSEPFSGHAFRVDLEAAQVRLVAAGASPTRRKVQDIVASYPAVVAVNASFFDVENRAMGLAVYDGSVSAGSKLRNWGAFAVNDKARILLGADIAEPLGHRLVVQGIPRLVVGGQIPSLKPQIAERTAVCAGGSVVVLVVSTRAESTPFARFLAERPDKGGLGCSDALNLDGGPSTQLVVRLPSLSLSLPGGWGVPNALVVAPGR